MRLNKAIKRMVALGTGATMVGATILGAMAAADLSKYPSPFVEKGAFNALIVVGAQAKTEDVLGAIDIATSLQYANKVTKALPGTGSTVSVTGEGVKIETGNNKLTVGESLNSVKNKLDENSLPILLAKGTYVNSGDDQSTSYDYTQKLEFGPNMNASVTWLRDSDYVTDPNNPNLLLYGPRTTGTGTAQTYFMRYTLDFTKLAESKWYSGTTCGVANELCDFEGTKVKILGIEYEITRARYDKDTKALTWEMMGGVSKNTMFEGESKTFTLDGKDYEVKVEIISDASPNTVVMSINGQSTKKLQEGQTDKVAGLEIGIKTLMTKQGSSRNMVEFYLGAKKLVLSDDDVSVAMGSKIKVGADVSDDVYSDFQGTFPGSSASSGTVKLQKIQLTWAPQDDLFLGKDESAALPGMNSFKVNFAGMTSSGSEETIKITPHGDDKIQIEAPLTAGTTSFDILYSSDKASWTTFGKSNTAGDGKLNTQAGTITRGDYIVLSNAANTETHIVELSSVSSANLTKLKDLANSVTYEATCSSTCTINVGNTAAVFSGVSNAASTATMTASSDVSTLVYTKEGLTIDLNSSAVNAANQSALSTTQNISIREEDENGALNNGQRFYVQAGFTSSKSTISGVTNVNAFVTAQGQSSNNYQFGDTGKYGYYSGFGTKVVYDTAGTQDSVVITYPGEEAHANVFVNSLDATVVSGGSGGSTYDETQRINVGAAVLDTEVSDLTAQNTIVVGGPCVNSLAAELMGNPANCAEGFEDGKAMVKLFEQSNGKVALLVAGYSAMDTRRASRVVAKYDSYKTNFVGTELEVTGTSLSDIKVGVPAPVAAPTAEETTPAETAPATQ